MARVVIEACGLDLGYAGVPVLRKLNLKVASGEIVALLGPNGAGKTTTALGLAGAIRPTGGEIRFLGESTKASLDKRARQGTFFVGDRSSVISSLSVRDNIRISCKVDAALSYFPSLEPHLDRAAGLLSGGQQQMLQVGRILGRDPVLIIADEISLGLSPIVIRDLFKALTAARDRGTAILLIEQHASRALAVADRGYVVRRGEIVLEGDSGDLSERLEDMEDLYLSTSSAKRE